jgi:aminopeptidase N
VQLAGTERDEALASFFKQYQHNGLVLLKWLALKSASNVPANLDAVDALQSHPAFDVKNPNCCYSLYLGCALGLALSSSHVQSGARLKPGPRPGRSSCLVSGSCWR